MDKQTNMQHVTLHKTKKPWYKRVWVWLLIIFILLCIGGGGASNNTKQNSSSNNNSSTNTPQTEPAKWDMETAYSKIENGMTKAQVEEATGKKAESCTENQSDYFGKTEYCSYGNVFIDKGSISVTYSQDVVSSKSKSSY